MFDDTTFNHSQVLDTIISVPASNNPLKRLSGDKIIAWLNVDINEPTEEVLSDEVIIQNMLNP